MPICVFAEIQLPLIEIVLTSLKCVVTEIQLPRVEILLRLFQIVS